MLIYYYKMTPDVTRHLHAVQQPRDPTCTPRARRDERTGQGGITIGRESSDPRAPAAARRRGCGMARWQIPDPVRSHDTVTHTER